MFSARRVIAFISLLHFSKALVKLTESKLYDETDFTQTVDVDNNFCELLGCRIYVSVPAASAEIAKNIIVKADNAPEEVSLYDISMRKKSDGQKDFFPIQVGNLLITFTNNNAGMATAPIAVWVVQANIASARDSLVYDAANLNTVAAPIDVVTVMSALPFILRTKTEGPMMSVATLSGYDAVYTGSDDDCDNVFDQLDELAYADVQVFVQSPLISLFYDRADFSETTVAVTAEVGNVNTLDFSGLTFVASPGYVCKGEKNYFSSLYDSATLFTYAKCGWLYDVDVLISTTTDAGHLLSLLDNTNEMEYSWPGTTPASLTLHQTNNLEITWTRNDVNLDQSFLIKLTPSHEQQILPEVPCPTPAEPQKEETTTPGGADVDPDRTTAAEGGSDQDKTTAPVPDDHTDGPVARTTVNPDQPDHTDPEPAKTTVKMPDDHTDAPVVETTVNPDQPDKDHTEPEPVKTTSRPATTNSTSLKTVHPRDISSTSSKPTSTTPTATTSAASEYGSTLLSLTLASVFLL